MEYNPREIYEKRTGKKVCTEGVMDETPGEWADEYIFDLEEQNKQMLEALIGLYVEHCNNINCVDCLYQDDSCRYREIRELIESITQKKITEEKEDV